MLATFVSKMDSMIVESFRRVLLLQPYLMVTTDVKGKHTAALLQLLTFLLHFLVKINTLRNSSLQSKSTRRFVRRMNDLWVSLNKNPDENTTK